MNRRGAVTGLVRRDPATGAHHAETPRFGLASSNKAILASVAVIHEVRRLCTAPNGGAGCDGGRWMALEVALATSKSPPFEWLARQFPDTTRRLMDGLHIRGEMATSPAFDAAYGIGRKASPADMIAYFDSLLAGRSPGLLVQGVPLLGPVDLDALGMDAGKRAEVRRLLAGPLSDGGTLAATGRMLRGFGVQPEMAKSGTHTEDGRNHVRTSIITSRLPDGRRFVSFVIATVTPHLLPVVRQVRNALKSQVLTVDRRPHFVTAEPPSDADQQVIDYFDLTWPAQSYLDVPLGDLKPVWVDARPEFTGTELFRLYRLPRHWRRWLRRASRDLDAA